MKKLLFCIISLWMFSISIGHSQKIKHRFLAKGESRSTLHYIDEFDSTNNWTIDIGILSRDIHLIEDNRILISCKDGFVEFDLKTKQKVAEVHKKEFGRTESVLRQPNGNTILGVNRWKKGTSIIEITDKGDVVRKIDFPNLKNIRILRFSPEGHFLFGANDDRIIETDWNKTIYKNIKIEGARHVYWIRKLSENHYRATTGYGKSLVDVDAKGNVLRKLGGNEEYYFFSRPFELANGNVVVSHWMGHDWNAGQKGVQLIEYDNEGNIVWQWHRPDIAKGSIHGVIVLQ